MTDRFPSNRSLALSDREKVPNEVDVFSTATMIDMQGKHTGDKNSLQACQ